MEEACCREAVVAAMETSEAEAAALVLQLLVPSLSTSILQSSICKAMQRSSIAIHSYTTTGDPPLTQF